MRNFRQVALAGATALAVTFGSTAVAAAGEPAPPAVAESGPSLSHKIGKDLESDQKADGRAIFGVQKEGFEAQPAWAKLLYGLLIFNSAAAFFGLVVGPAYNFIVHGPINFR